MKQSLMDVMNKIDKDSYIEAEWNSTRSDERQSASGIVTEVVCRRSGEKVLKFRRDDGQLMIIRENYNIYSAGSHFSLTGSVTNLEIV